MSEDDRFDALLKQMAAEEYHRPPQIVPREAMWDAVRAELARPAAGAAARGAGARRVSPSVRRFAALAIAALLLLAVGIGIGRQWGANGAGPSSSIAGNDRTPPASRDSSDPAVPGASVPAGSLPGGQAPGSSQPDDRQMLASSDNPARPSGPDRSATDQTRPRPTGPDRAAPNDLAGGPGGTTAYSVAAVHHLTEVEALLTAFKSDVGERRMDAQIATWAKDLLSSTRLLLDSPAGQDVARRKLLQDLELVLVQIVQLSPGTSDTERDMIKGALTEDQVLTRLRTAIPAGQRGA